jgi:hypothetical protein
LATPAALEYGGQRRVLVVQPAGFDRSKGGASPAVAIPVTEVAGCDNDTTVCVEADSLSVQHVALDLVERRRDRVEFADRVHTRTDVAWAPLVSTECSQKSVFWGTDASRQTQAQHPMSQTLVM